MGPIFYHDCVECHSRKKVAICLFMAFLYNACIPDFSCTTLYTVVCKKMTFL